MSSQVFSKSPILRSHALAQSRIFTQHIIPSVFKQSTRLFIAPKTLSEWLKRGSRMYAVTHILSSIAPHPQAGIIVSTGNRAMEKLDVVLRYMNSVPPMFNLPAQRARGPWGWHTWEGIQQSVLVCIRSSPHRPMSLNPCSPLGGTGSGKLENIYLQGEALLEEVFPFRASLDVL